MENTVAWKMYSFKDKYCDIDEPSNEWEVEVAIMIEYTQTLFMDKYFIYLN